MDINTLLNASTAAAVLRRVIAGWNWHSMCFIFNRNCSSRNRYVFENSKNNHRAPCVSIRIVIDGEANESSGAFFFYQKTLDAKMKKRIFLITIPDTYYTHCSSATGHKTFKTNESKKSCLDLLIYIWMC